MRKLVYLRAHILIYIARVHSYTLCHCVPWPCFVVGCFPEWLMQISQLSVARERRARTTYTYTKYAQTKKY